MDRLTAFGLFAVTAMLICYAFEARRKREGARRWQEVIAKFWNG